VIGNFTTDRQICIFGSKYVAKTHWRMNISF
jgi:hypothetical protein